MPSRTAMSLAVYWPLVVEKSSSALSAAEPLAGIPVGYSIEQPFSQIVASHARPSQGNSLASCSLRCSTWTRVFGSRGHLLGGSSMATAATSSDIVNRMVRAAKLEVPLYEEVEADVTATNQALLIVLLVALASGIGAAIGAAPGALIGRLI